MELILASNNQNKLKELNALLSPLGFHLLKQGDLKIPEAEEPFDTFVENALTKARHAARLGGKPAIADDSGICVPALGGAPGVQSARYAQQPGGPKSDAANNELLLQRMQGQADRQARFVCALVAVRHANDPEPLIATGRWNGEILHELRGNGGFGYDPLMFIPALGKTVAELDAHEKNLHSHRAQAMQQMLALMKSYWADSLSHA